MLTESVAAVVVVSIGSTSSLSSALDQLSSISLSYGDLHSASELSDYSGKRKVPGWRKASTCSASDVVGNAVIHARRSHWRFTIPIS